MTKFWTRLVAAFLFAAIVAMPNAHAQVVDLSGTDGFDGADNQAGGNGGDGSSMTLTSVTVGDILARGGRGGKAGPRVITAEFPCLDFVSFVDNVIDVAVVGSAPAGGNGGNGGNITLNGVTAGTVSVSGGSAFVDFSFFGDETSGGDGTKCLWNGQDISLYNGGDGGDGGNSGNVTITGGINTLQQVNISGGFGGLGGRSVNSFFGGPSSSFGATGTRGQAGLLLVTGGANTIISGVTGFGSTDAQVRIEGGDTFIGKIFSVNILEVTNGRLTIDTSEADPDFNAFKVEVIRIHGGEVDLTNAVFSGFELEGGAGPEPGEAPDIFDLDGGTLSVLSVDSIPNKASFGIDGTLTWNAGTLAITGVSTRLGGTDTTIRRALGGDTLQLGDNQRLLVNELVLPDGTSFDSGTGEFEAVSVTVEQGAVAEFEGGSAIVDTLDVRNGGVVRLKDAIPPGTPPPGTVVELIVFQPKILNDGTIIVMDSMTIGDEDKKFDYSGSGSMSLADSSITLEILSNSFVNTAGLAPNGGAIVSTGGFALGTFGLLESQGELRGRFAQQFGSIIRANGPLSIGDPNSSVGFAADGELYVQAQSVTLNDSNVAVLGTLTSIAGGTLRAPNGMFVEKGKNLEGFGQVENEFINDGTALGTGGTLEFTGDVSGDGDFLGSILFSGTFSPGNSPALVTVDDATLGPDAILRMELFGVEPGTEYDQLNILTQLNIDGVLELMFLGGFVPGIGDEFTLFDTTGGTVNGAFQSITVSGLPAGLGVDTSALISGGGLVVVPEPGTLILLALSGISLVGRSRGQR